MPQYCVPCDRRAYTYSHTALFFFLVFIPFPSGLPYSLGLKKNPTGSKHTTTTPPTTILRGKMIFRQSYQMLLSRSFRVNPSDDDEC